MLTIRQLARVVLKATPVQARSVPIPSEGSHDT